MYIITQTSTELELLRPDGHVSVRLVQGNGYFDSQWWRVEEELPNGKRFKGMYMTHEKAKALFDKVCKAYMEEG